MADIEVNGIRFHYEESGEGAPITCIHGTGGSALMWGEAVPNLARLGRVITYDRRGCTRTERPEPYLDTSVAEHAGDAAALLEALEAAPAVVIGRSYGGAVAIDLAAHHPDLVRALVLLEPLAPTSKAIAWINALAARLRAVAEDHGPDAVGEAFIGEVLEEGAWDSFPEALQRMFTYNGPAILAETQGDPPEADAAALSSLEIPVLLVAAADSAPEFRESTEALAEGFADAHISLVGGGHLIDPASSEVLDFIREVLDASEAAGGADKAKPTGSVSQ